MNKTKTFLIKFIMQLRNSLQHAYYTAACFIFLIFPHFWETSWRLSRRSDICTLHARSINFSAFHVLSFRVQHFCPTEYYEHDERTDVSNYLSGCLHLYFDIYLLCFCFSLYFVFIYCCLLNHQLKYPELRYGSWYCLERSVRLKIAATVRGPFSLTVSGFAYIVFLNL